MGYRPRGAMPKVARPPQGGSGLMRPGVTRVPISPSPRGQRSGGFVYPDIRALDDLVHRRIDFDGKPTRPPLDTGRLSASITKPPPRGWHVEPVFQVVGEDRGPGLLRRLLSLFVRPRSQLPTHVEGSRLGRW